MDSSQRDLRAYYEEEARLRLRKPVTGHRVELRNAFIALLRAEGRHAVIDLGAGPGRDGEAFAAAGLDYFGLDLAHTNGVLAAERGVRVVQGSVTAPPFRAESFDAGWSMSTLMHLPETELSAALPTMIAPLRAGSPFFVGLWGGEQGDFLSAVGIPGRQRRFCHRLFEVNHRLLAACATVEHATVWDLGVDEWEYHVFRLRIR